MGDRLHLDTLRVETVTVPAVIISACDATVYRTTYL